MKMLHVAAAILPLMLLLPACGGGRDRGADMQRAPTGWRGLATDADRERLRTWRDAWLQGLAKIVKPADRTAVAAQGALLQPDSGQPDPAPPPGEYRCRVIKIGSKTAGGMNYVAYPAYTCQISGVGEALHFSKINGSQRPVGQLYPDDGGRMIFLGTMVLGDEDRALAYGRDPERDMAGLVERIGTRRWRLVLPFPRWESTIDVIELVPASGAGS